MVRALAVSRALSIVAFVSKNALSFIQVRHQRISEDIDVWPRSCLVRPVDPHNVPFDDGDTHFVPKRRFLLL